MDEISSSLETSINNMIEMDDIFDDEIVYRNNDKLQNESLPVKETKPPVKDNEPQNLPANDSEPQSYPTEDSKPQICSEDNSKPKIISGENAKPQINSIEEGKPKFVSNMCLNDNKAGMVGLDKDKINAIIEKASKGSKFYNHKLKKQQELDVKIQEMKMMEAKLTDKQLSEAAKQVRDNNIIPIMIILGVKSYQKSS